jgi:hypothetical protein
LGFLPLTITKKTAKSLIKDFGRTFVLTFTPSNKYNMTEETKKQLMQNVYKIATHYQIPNAELVSFKKRSVLLELLNSKDETAFNVVNDVIEAEVKLDRIQNDKEKQTKKPEHWSAEVFTTQKAKEKAEEKLKKFFEENKI